MVRLVIYELTKTIASNNVSQIRMRDYEDSMKWLYDASKLKLNPQRHHKGIAGEIPAQRYDEDKNLTEKQQVKTILKSA